MPLPCSAAAILYLTLIPSLLGCSVFPTRPQPCGAGNPCRDGQFCESSTGFCEDPPATADMTSAVPTDLAQAGDLPRPLVDTVRVPAGTFNMGSIGVTEGTPVHSQTVAAFSLDRTLVTVRAFATCRSSGKCKSNPRVGAGCNWTVAGREEHPVNCVDWNQALEYCVAQGGRLPSEIEYEYVLRGTSSSEYAWGSEGPYKQLCWQNPVSTCPVDSFPRTLFGAVNSDGFADLSGNVEEWTSYPKCSYPLPRRDPDLVCPPGLRATRGSRYDSSSAALVRVAERGFALPAVQTPSIGFRCAY